MSFKNLPSRTVHHTGIQYLAFYPNGYGASIVQHDFSYGGKENLWELAVIKGTEEDWNLCYSTPITGDVLGYLTEQDVDDTLKQIESLVDSPTVE
jgi:hypothetical protein